MSTRRGRMDKREFLELSSALVAAPVVSAFGRSQPSAERSARLKNWAGNLEYHTDRVHYPKTVAEVQQLVKQHDRLRALGTRHCFNTIADSTSALISLRDMNTIVAINAKKGRVGTVTIEGGMSYGQLCPLLHAKGFGLRNLASLPHISVAGSTATATHGSGTSNGNLSTAVRGLEIVTADGSVVTLSRNDGDAFNGAVVHLGAIGVVTKVTLEILSKYTMQQYVFERLPMKEAFANFDKIVGAGYSVSLFTDWQHDSFNEVWLKSLVYEPEPSPKPMPDFFGATLATKNLHPIADLSAENCTEQMGVRGPWYERLPHFRMGFTPSSGTELQAEYFVPRQHAVEAISAIARMGKEIGPHLLISEIRTIAADQLWMSPCYQQDSVAIHFTWKQDWPAVSALLPVIEKELAPFTVRPHWGKLFTLSPGVLQSRYAKIDDYKQLVAKYDPRGKFRNEFLEKNLYGA